MKIIENGKISVSPSELNAYTMCPMKYKFRYIENKRGYYSAFNLFFGTAVHSTIESVLQGVDKGEAIGEAVDYIQKQAKDMPPQDFLNFDIGYWSEALETMIDAWEKEYLPEINKGKSETELKLEKDIDDQYSVHGFADLVEINEKNTKIVDWKTCGRLPKKWKADHRLQGLIYSYMASQDKEDFPVVEFVYIRKPNPNYKKMATGVKVLILKPKKEDYEWLKMLINNMVQSFESGVFPPTGCFSEKWGNPACRWCDFGNTKENRDLQKQGKIEICPFSHWEI